MDFARRVDERAWTICPVPAEAVAGRRRRRGRRRSENKNTRRPLAQTRKTTVSFICALFSFGTTPRKQKQKQKQKAKSKMQREPIDYHFLVCLCFFRFCCRSIDPYKKRGSHCLLYVLFQRPHMPPCKNAHASPKATPPARPFNHPTSPLDHSLSRCRPTRWATPGRTRARAGRTRSGRSPCAACSGTSWSGGRSRSSRASA